MRFWNGAARTVVTTSLVSLATLDIGAGLRGHLGQNPPVWRDVIADAFVTGGPTR
jgi:hypothetical protein